MIKRSTDINDYIKQLDMNGLAGRMVHLPSKKNREILFIYGQHSSLERWWGLLQYVGRYGTVTAPDLPGFGGMESFYKIGEKPTLDTYADYLASFMKLRYRRKKVVIIGMSLGFVIATRMLQRYPELSKNVSVLVSLAGFTHHDDFVFPKQRYWYYRVLSTVCSYWVPAMFFRYAFLNSFVLRKTYHHTYTARSKFAAAKTPAEHDLFMDMEIRLWHQNDPRTHAYTTVEMLTLDNCTKRLDVPVWHVSVSADQYLDPHRVEQHLLVAFHDVTIVASKQKQHAPSIIADEAAAALLFPPKLRQLLRIA